MKLILIKTSADSKMCGVAKG